MPAQTTQGSALSARFLEPSEGPAVRALFHAAFNDTMSEALWNWKYRARNSGCVGVFRGDELIAHYGSIDVPVCYFGKPAQAVQIVDVMVKPAFRRAVKRETSPFFVAGHYFADHSVGYDRPFLLGYGFPSDRHMLLARHLGLYEPVGRMFEVVWQVPPNVPGPGFWCRVARIGSDRGLAPGVGTEGSLAPDKAVAQNPRTRQVGQAQLSLQAARPAITRLWRQLQVELIEHVVVRKDADWLERRYLTHPEKQYAVYLLRQRFTGQPLSVIVLKVEDTRVQLMDYIGPFARLDQAIGVARHLTRVAGKDVLYTWCSEAFVPRFSCHGASAHALQITTPATTRMPGPTAEELRDRWWLMPGDTDFL